MRGEGSTTWRYAMTRETVQGVDGPEYLYTIREVYTGPNGELSWTTDPIAARGDDWRECANDLALMQRALGSAVLDISADPPRWITLRELKEEKT